MALGLRRLQRLGLIIYKGERIKMGHEEKKMQSTEAYREIGIACLPCVAHKGWERSSN